MILDDLFEQKPLPAHIKASDLPPGMRPRLTMRDVERERPRGAYRYRVIPGTPGESPKDFLDLAGAEQYAQAVRGRVQPLEEQASDPDVQRGMANLNAIEQQIKTNQRVYIQNETGRPAYQIELPVDKQWLISHAEEWIDAGKASELYKFMGTKAGFDFLVSAWQKEDVIRAKSRKQQDTHTTEPDLFGVRHSGGPKSPRYQDESQHGQKKRSEVAEAPQGARGRTERMMAQMRARQPQATSDLEALAYELQDAEQRDAQEIDKLEKEVNDLETDIKSDLQKRIATLTRRRGGIRQASASDVKIDATLDQLARVNDQQQREINDLTKAIASIGQAQPAAAAPALAPVAAAAKQEPSRIEIPAIAKSKTPIPPAEKPSEPKAAEPTDTFARGIVEPLTTMPKTEPVKTAAADPAGDDGGQDFRKRWQVASDQEDLFKQAAESLAEAPNQDIVDQLRSAYQQARQAPAPAPTGAQDMVDRVRGTAVGRMIEPAVRKAGQAIAGTKIGQKVGQEVGMAKSALGTLGRAVLGRRYQQPVPAAAAASTTQTPAAVAPAVSTTPAAPATATSGNIILSPGYTSTRSQQQQTAMQDIVKQATAMTPAEKTAAMPAGWKMGDPIVIAKQRITSKDPNYAKIVAAMTRQPVAEKKRPQPTNPDLWSRAKSAARSKFDVYPSAYANAWAAKWYKSKGGGWRMGKPKKK